MSPMCSAPPISPILRRFPRCQPCVTGASISLTAKWSVGMGHASVIVCAPCGTCCGRRASGLPTSPQIELLHKKRSDGLLSARIEMFIVGIIDGLLGALLAQHG